jgi:hypothetical protein
VGGEAKKYLLPISMPKARSKHSRASRKACRLSGYRERTFAPLEIQGLVPGENLTIDVFSPIREHIWEPSPLAIPSLDSPKIGLASPFHARTLLAFFTSSWIGSSEYLRDLRTASARS